MPGTKNTKKETKNQSKSAKSTTKPAKKTKVLPSPKPADKKPKVAKQVKLTKTTGASKLLKSRKTTKEAPPKQLKQPKAPKEDFTYHFPDDSERAKGRGTFSSGFAKLLIQVGLAAAISYIVVSMIAVPVGVYNNSTAILSRQVTDLNTDIQNIKLDAASAIETNQLKARIVEIEEMQLNLWNAIAELELWIVELDTAP